MSSLLSGFFTPVAATASSAAANFPAVAAIVPGVLRGWQSTAGGAQWLQLDLGFFSTVRAVALQAIAFSGTSITVQVGTTNPPAVNVGTLVVGVDGNARSKASLTFSPTTVRYVRFNFNGTVGTCGVGSAFAFGATDALPVDPLYGQTGIRYIDPQVRDELPNGVVEVYSAGAPTTEIDLAFGPSATDDVELVRRAARAGPCWLDLGLSNVRGRQWPVRHVEADTQRRFDRINRESIGISLREIT